MLGGVCVWMGLRPSHLVPSAMIPDKLTGFHAAFVRWPPNRGVSNCVIYVRRPNAGHDYRPGGEKRLGCLWRRANGGVNGRFIYHRCHNLPERKSALPN